MRRRFSIRRLAIIPPLLLLITASGCVNPAAQSAISGDSAGEWTMDRDHTDMMRQLGITRLRPGPGGQTDAPNAANYDEALANPFPNWPPLLQTDSGIAVTDAEMWWQQRRPEIVAAFEQEIVGHVPADAPAVHWTLAASETATIAGTSVVGTHFSGIVDNEQFPEINVEIDMTLVLPEDSARAVPVMIMFRRATLQQALGKEPLRRFAAPQDSADNDPPAMNQLIAAGWGYVLLDPTSIQEDNGAGLTRGIIGLTNQGRPRQPDDWGALRAWSWGAARALDLLETMPSVDATSVGIEGVSRYGKAALVTMAFEPRFAVGLIGSSGEGGVSPYRRNFGEMIENLTGRGEYHWMAGNFLKYGAEESRFGRMNAADLPIDSHSLIALAAPRPLFISYGIPEREMRCGWIKKAATWRR